MNQDKLYLIKPHFTDQGKTYYCPGCAEMTGLLEFYPALKRHIEIRWVAFARPRPELVALLGKENQSCPVLVLHSVPPSLPADLKVQHANGHAFVADAREIGEYLAHTQGIGLPHYQYWLYPWENDPLEKRSIFRHQICDSRLQRGFVQRTSRLQDQGYLSESRQHRHPVLPGLRRGAASEHAATGGHRLSHHSYFGNS